MLINAKPKSDTEKMFGLLLNKDGIWSDFADTKNDYTHKF